MKATPQTVEQLADVLDRGVPSDELDRDLRELVAAARAVEEHTVVPRPDPGFRNRLRSELIEVVERDQITLLDRVRDELRVRTARLRHSLRVATATGMASLMIGGASVGVAAQEAAPGDLLYGVKQLTESVRMGLASGTQETGRLHLRFANERLSEILARHEQMSPDLMIETLQAMDRATRAGTRDLIATYRETADGEVLAILDTFADTQRRELSAVFGELPAEVQPFAVESLSLLERLQQQVGLVGEDVCAACGEVAAARSESDLLPRETLLCGRCRDPRPDDTAEQPPAPAVEPDVAPEPLPEVDEPTGEDPRTPLRDRAEDSRLITGTTEVLDELAGDTGNTLEGTTQTVEDTTTETVEDTTDEVTEDLDDLLSPSSSEDETESTDDGGLLD